MSDVLEKAVDINEHGIYWREGVGAALHHAAHPGHEWSGCDDPDAVYDTWMPRFLLYLRQSAYDVHAVNDYERLLRIETAAQELLPQIARWDDERRTHTGAGHLKAVVALRAALDSAP